MMASNDPNILKGTTEDHTVEEVEELHGVINPNEAAILVHSLDEVLILMEAQIVEGEERDMMGNTVVKFKEAIS